MSQLRSIVNAADLKKAISNLPPAGADEGEPFKAIKGTQKGQKEPAGGLFVGPAMLRSFAKEKETFTSAQVFEGTLRRSPKDPTKRLILVSTNTPGPLKEVALACLHEAKLPYKVVVLRPEEPEPDTLSDDAPTWQPAAVPADRQPARPELQPGVRPAAAATPAPAAWQPAVTPTARTSSDPAVEMVRTAAKAAVAEIAKAIRDPGHGSQVKQLYDRLTAQMRTAADPQAIQELQATWASLLAFLPAGPPPAPPASPPPATDDAETIARRRFEFLGGETALQAARVKGWRTVPTEQANALTFGQRVALLQELTDTRSPFDRLVTAPYNALQPKLLALQQRDPKGSGFVERAFTLNQAAADGGDLAKAGADLQKLADEVDARLAELEATPASTAELMAGARTRLAELDAKRNPLSPEDAADISRLLQLPGLARRHLNKEELPEADATAMKTLLAKLAPPPRGRQPVDQPGVPEQELAVTQYVLEKVETLHRRALGAARAYHKAEHEVPPLFEELMARDALRGTRVTTDCRKSLTGAVEAAQRHDYHAALGHLDRARARARGLAERLDWEKRIAGAGDLKKAALKKLGQANQGIVFDAQLPGAPSLVVKIPWQYYPSDEANYRDLIHEAEAYEKIGDHPNIARCLGLRDVYVDQKNAYDPPVNEYLPKGTKKGMVMERLAGTVEQATKELRARMMDRTISQEEYWGTVQHMLAGMLQGLEHLADQGYAHADLKSDNVMFDDAGVVKLVDMGLANPADKLRVVGAPGYQAPETKTGSGTGPLTPKVDVYSLGKMLFEYAEGIVGKDAPFKTNRSGQYVDFVKAAMAADPANRSSAQDLLRHPFLQERLLDEDAAANVLRRLKPTGAAPAPPLAVPPPTDLKLGVAAQEKNVKLLAEHVRQAIAANKGASFFEGLFKLLSKPESELKRLQELLAAAQPFDGKDDLGKRIDDARNTVIELMADLVPLIFGNED